MSKRLLKACLVAGSLAGLTVLAGCDEAPPPAPPPPPPVAVYEPPPPPPALLGAPVAAPEQDFVAMAPIPNPEDLPPAERRRIYGDRFWTSHRYIAGVVRARHRGARHHLTPYRVAQLHAPGYRGPEHHGAEQHRAWQAAPVPHTVATVAPTRVSKPVAPKLLPPRIIAPKIVSRAPVVAAPVLSSVDRLAAAVTAKSKGAVLAVPADLSAAKPGAVTLSLPADLLATIRQEAAKLGLGRAAKKTEVTATLHGDGYTITPPGPQTVPLVAGKPATFSWQVTPGAGAKGPLTADVNAALKGAGKAKTFALAKLQQAVAAVDAAVAQAQAATHAFKLPSLGMLAIPGHPDVNLPLLGKTPSGSVVGAAIALIVLLLLMMTARSASARREAEERQRRYRTMATGLAFAPVVETVTPVAAEAPVEPVEPVVEPVAEHVVAGPGETEAVVADQVATGEPVAEPVRAEHEAAAVEAPVLHAPGAPSVVGLKPAEPESHEHPFDPVPANHPAVAVVETPEVADHEPAKTVLVEAHDDHHALETV